MIDDTNTPGAGPNGTLVGLVEQHGRVPPAERKARPKREKPTTMNYRTPHEVDPLDKAFQDRRGKRADEVQLDEPIPGAYDNQILWAVVGRIDGGPWSHLLAAENIRAATFPSRRRAEATVEWFRRQAEVDANGCEYRVIPVMRGEKAI
jgi:hypothetical protein